MEKIYVVTYVGISDTEYDANGFCNVFPFKKFEDAKAKFDELKKNEIDFLEEEDREYEVLEDDEREWRLSWCGHGEQLRVEIHEKELN